MVLCDAMRRVDCQRCGVKVEGVPWAMGKHGLTQAYLLFLAHWARKLSWTETARWCHTSWDTVCHAVEYVVDWGLARRSLTPLRAIGVDEIQYGRGHRYLTLVYQIDAQCTRLLWVGQERTIESFQRFFTLIGQEIAGTIEFVCSDMWKPYLQLIERNCPQALNILDRFHVVAKMNKAIDEVRAGEARRLVRDGYEPVLKKSRWCLLKRKEDLTDLQRIRLRDLLRYNLKSVRAYLLKEHFQQFWDYISPTWAGKFLDEWCRQVMRSPIEPMKKFARTLRSHRELLLNYFRARKAFSSGVIEGLNNKAKVTMRISYGFRTFRILELALYHTFGKLPEPQLTHSFFSDEPKMIKMILSIAGTLGMLCWTSSPQAAELSSVEVENLVRRSYQYVALYDTIVNWALNEKSPFYSGGWNKAQLVVVVLEKPRLEAGSLLYDVDVLDGDETVEGGACSLFIDVIGRPFTPLSYAGMGRRVVRRTSRRTARRVFRRRR